MNRTLTEMSLRLARTGLALALAALAATAPAFAQEPTFAFTAPVPAPAWKASAQLGFTASGGNTGSVGGSVSANVSRRHGDWRVLAEGRGAYARSRIQVATESDGVPGIGPGEVQSLTQTTTEAWALQLRTDRYFTEKNSLYFSMEGTGDRPAGTRFRGGGQVGYGRALASSRNHTLTLELGYDVAHQVFVTSTEATTSHSARLFLGEEYKPWDPVTLRLSGDALVNLARERGPIGPDPAFQHLRSVVRAEVDVKVNAHGSLGLHLASRYDSSPAPLPPIGGVAWQAGYTPLAQRTDHTAELVFVYAFP